MRLLWSERALSDLQKASEWSLIQAEAVVNSLVWMAETGFSLGRQMPDAAEKYWPVPPLGAFYREEGDVLRVLRVIDVRRRVQPW